MNLREKFEKETGEPYKKGGEVKTIFNEKYTEWLEQRNKELVEVLKEVYHEVNHSDTPEEGKISYLTNDKIEEQLKKSDCQLGG